jgi:hypothetical protein
MPRHNFTPEKLRAIDDLVASWGKIVARRAFGDDGPDLTVDLDALEQVAQAAAQGLGRSTLETLLRLQTLRLPDPQPCPACGRPCPVGCEDRPLVTQGGRITYHEPVCSCPDCRRDFFPPPGRPAAGQP